LYRIVNALAAKKKFLQLAGIYSILSGTETKKKPDKTTKNPYNPEQFGKRLKEARLKSGIDVDEASKILGIEKNSYYKYEDGRRFPKPDILAAIMDKFHLSIDYLITGQGQISFHRDETTEAKISILKRYFPGISLETYPLIESLQVPIIKHVMMTHYLVERETYKTFIDEFFNRKEENVSE